MTLRSTCLMLTGLILLAGLSACTTQQRHAWLTVFFEGVPPLEVEKPHPAAPVELMNLVSNQIPGHPTNTVKLLPHTPYRERKCNTCHAPDQPRKMKGTQREICYPCHTNVLTKLQVQHFPARKWLCLSCHQPHMSTVGKLLRKPVVALCYTCHKSLNNKRYVHEPVKQGFCLSCHPAHQSPYPNRLKQAGDSLCLLCHKAAAMKAALGHAGMGDKKCLQCHDAHQSDKKGRLK